MPPVLASLSTKQKLTLGASVLATLIAAVVLFKMATAPSYTEVMAGVDPAQTSKVTAALDAKGVSYQLRANGTAIAVVEGDLGAARIALATAGVSGTTTQPGFELLDKQKLGASNFQQQIAYQRGLEGQIASTLRGIAGVSGATVSLTLPKDQLFADQSQAATAAVLLQGDASTLDPGAIRGMASLVAGSVEGLKTSNVTIADGTGAMLWPQGDGASGGSKVAVQASYDAQLGSQLNAMLASTLGAGKAQAVVHSDLNVDQSTLERLQYAKKGVPLSTKKTTETLKGTGGSTAGVTGTASNIPSYAQSTGGTGNSNYKRTDGQTDWGVDKTITKTVPAPGAVNRLSVALMVDKSVPPAVVTQLKNAMANAAGLQFPRDPAVAVTQVAFPKAAVIKAGGPVPVAIVPYLKGGAIGLAVLLFLFFMTRQLRRREKAPFAEEPAWLRNLEQPFALPAAGETGGDAARLDEFDPQAAARQVFENDPRALALEELVEREPEKVAHQLRTWITEEN